MTLVTAISLTVTIAIVTDIVIVKAIAKTLTIVIDITVSKAIAITIPQVSIYYKGIVLFTHADWLALEVISQVLFTSEQKLASYFVSASKC